MNSQANPDGTVELGECAILTRNAAVDRLEEWGTRNFRYRFKAERKRIYAVSTLRQKIKATVGALRFIWL
jgi:ribosomal protein S6